MKTVVSFLNESVFLNEKFEAELLLFVPHKYMGEIRGGVFVWQSMTVARPCPVRRAVENYPNFISP